MPRSTTRGLPEPVFWADENIGTPDFVSTLRVEGRLRVEVDTFPDGTHDTVWIPAVAANQWTAITQDHLKSDLEEQVALVLHGARVFVLIGNGRHKELAQLFLRKIKWVKRLIAASDEAFLGKIYVNGGKTAVVTLADLCSRSSRRWGRRQPSPSPSGSSLVLPVAGGLPPHPK